LVACPAATRATASTVDRTSSGASGGSLRNGVDPDGQGLDTAPRQSPAQQVSPTGQAAADGAQRAAQLHRRLLLRQALPVAEHHRGAVLLGQPPHFLLHDRAEFAAVDLVGIGRLDGFDDAGRRTFLDGPTARRPDPDAGRRPAGDAVEPAPHRIQPADRARPAHQDQERGLEGVVGVVGVAEPVAADAQDHRPVAQHQHLERGRVAMVDEPFEQLPVGQPAGGPGFEERMDVAQQLDGRTPGHAKLPCLDQGLYR
jgi:hypothetical protein